ncbi:MAG TPA: YraN family protein [Chitinophagaceae bacterium]|nr:YraN family protein [Chitinophagaceae bacterium]
MNTKRQFGNEGEQRAVEHLKKAGYEIVACNWTHGHKEIDIIARQDDIYVFVEVKTRTSTVLGYPEESVSKAKMQSVCEAARIFLYDKTYRDIRFDVISVICPPGEEAEIFHIRDAFY